MQTGWEHDDHQSRREFERLRNRTSESTEKAEEASPLRRGRPISSSEAPSQGPVGIRSPLETIDVTVNGSWWEIDRPLTVWVNGSPVEVRDNGEPTTVRDIHFEDTASVAWTVVRRGRDAVTVTAVSSGGGGSYDWDVTGDTGGPSTITSGGQLNIVGGTDISTALTGTGPWDLTINYTGTTYTGWTYTSDIGVGTVPVASGDIVAFVGQNGIVTNHLAGGAGDILYIDRPLTFYRTTDTDTVGFTSGTNITEVYFENDVASKPAGYTKRAWVDVANPVSGRVKMEVWYEDLSGGGSYDWDVTGDTGGPSTITSGGQLNIVGGTNISTALTGTGPWTLTINNTYSYDWVVQADTGGPSSVGAGVVVDIAGGTGVDTALTGAGPYTVTINRPLTIEDDNVAVGGADTLFINFDSQLETTTAQAVNFVVTDDGTGQRSVKAYVPSSAGSYDWDVQADTGGPSTLVSGAVLDIAGGTGVDTVLTGAGPFTVTVNRPLTIEDDNVAVGGGDTLYLNFDSQAEATTAQAVNFVVTDDGAGQRSVKAYVPASGGSYDWTVAADSGSELVTSGSTITWAGGTNIITVYDSGTNTVTINSDYVYFWNLGANGAATTQIDHNEDVQFYGLGKAFASRSNNDITYRVDAEDTEDDSGSNTLTGYVTWDLTGVGARTDYQYGTIKSADIVHNWNLRNMHGYELYLEDVTIQEDSTDPGYGVDKDYYRSGATTMSGEVLADQYIALHPYVQAFDNNTIRLWMRHTRGYPTVIKMWYVLRKA